jgi:hypothetical protein
LKPLSYCDSEGAKNNRAEDVKNDRTTGGVCRRLCRWCRLKETQFPPKRPDGVRKIQMPRTALDQVGASLAVRLVNKAPKEHRDFRVPIIWGTSANIDLY